PEGPRASPRLLTSDDPRVDPAPRQRSICPWRDERSAGARPNTTPVRTATTAANPKTVPSIAIALRCGNIVLPGAPLPFDIIPRRLYILTSRYAQSRFP